MVQSHSMKTLTCFLAVFLAVSAALFWRRVWRGGWRPAAAAARREIAGIAV